MVIYNNMINTNTILYEQINNYPLFTDKIKCPKINLSTISGTDYQINVEQINKCGLLDDFKNYLFTNIYIADIFSVFETKNEKNHCYINFAIKKSYLFNILVNFNNNNKISLIHTLEPKTILFDYSSPNLAKDMHVGHLRSTIIGDCLANIFEYVGHKVLRRNHIGDFGLPFGIIVEYCIEHNIVVDESLILQDIYVLAKKQFDTDVKFADLAYIRTQKLQSETDETTNTIWKAIYSHSLKSYNNIYKLLNISEKLEIKGESFYKNYIEQVQVFLDEKKLIEKVDDRVIVSISKSMPMTFIKSESKGNAFTYDTTDIVALYYRLIVEHADNIYYIVDQGQSSHFEQLFMLFKNLNMLEHHDIQHIGFGVVQGENNKRLKSRDGYTPKLIDLINDAITYTKKIYLEKHSSINEECIRAIAVSSLKYFDLAMCRTSNYQFNFSKMLQFTGNTYTYITYALVRCNAILNKTLEYHESLMVINIDELTDSDFEILRNISYLPNILEKVMIHMTPHLLCSQLYIIADLFHTNYEKTRCINFDSDNNIIFVNKSRILLYKFIKYIIETCYMLIGVSCIDTI